MARLGLQFPLRPPVRWASRGRVVRRFEILVLACAVLALFAAHHGRLSTSGPKALIGLTCVGWCAGAVGRRAAFARLAVLAVALVGGYAVRRSVGHPDAHLWLGRLALSWGLSLAALFAVPTGAGAALARLLDVATATPRRRASLAGLGVAAPVWAFLATVPTWGLNGDTQPVVATVARVLRDGTRDLSADVVENRGGAYPHSWLWTLPDRERPYFVCYSPVRPGLYSAYPAGMELPAAPVVLAFAAAGADVGRGDVRDRIERVTAAGVAAVALAVFFLTALRLGSPAAALATTWLLAVGSVFSSTLGLALWQHGGVITGTLVVLLVEFRAGGRVGWRGTLVQAAACGWMFACRLSAVTFLVPFGVWVFARDWRRGVALPAAAAGCYLPWLALYLTTYGTPFGPAVGQAGGHWDRIGAHLGGVLFSPARGLLVYQSWVALVALWLVPAVRREDGPAGPPGWGLCLAAAACGHLLLISSWPPWWGGYCWGSRLAAEAVPLAGLAVVRPVGYLLRSRTGCAVFLTLGLLGAALHAPFVGADTILWPAHESQLPWFWDVTPNDVNAHPERLWDWSRAPFLFWSPIR